MTFRIDPVTRFEPLHTELPHKEDDGYAIRFTKGDVGKIFTVKYRLNASIDPDVGSAYDRFDCELIGKVFAGSRLEIVACTKDKGQQDFPDPEVSRDEFNLLGSWSLLDGTESKRMTQKFNALDLGTRDRKLFLLVLGIRVVACVDPSRVKLKTLEYTVG